MSKKKPDIAVRKESLPGRAERWPPMLALRNEIDRVFDDFGAGSWGQPFSRRMHALLPTGAEWALRPATELVECDGEYRLTAELPGMTADDIDIRLSDGKITVRGETTEAKKEEKEDYLVSERRYGAFRRSLSLPSGIDTDTVTAESANGLLTVTLPKTPDTKQKERRVEVTPAT